MLEQRLSVFDVAKYILKKDIYGMTSMKLQKLCYYSQAYSLAWTATPLFSERVSAREHGPIIYDLYDQHRGLVSIDYSDLSGAPGDASRVSGVQQKIIDSVVSQLGGLSAKQLRDQTHGEAPWIDARSSDNNAEITHKAMERYYGK